MNNPSITSYLSKAKKKNSTMKQGWFKEIMKFNWKGLQKKRTETCAKNIFNISRCTRAGMANQLK